MGMLIFEDNVIYKKIDGIIGLYKIIEDIF